MEAVRAEVKAAEKRALQAMDRLARDPDCLELQEIVDIARIEVAALMAALSAQERRP